MTCLNVYDVYDYYDVFMVLDIIFLLLKLVFIFWLLLHPTKLFYKLTSVLIKQNAFLIKLYFPR